MAVIYIVVLIGVLVFVHEFGHYSAARLFNVKVLSFSIGFGPKIKSFQRGETSWDLRWLPLGGYVQMYGTEFEEVTDDDDPEFERAYNNKPIWQKAIICFAGPLFNLLLPIPILFGVYFATVTEDFPPVIGQIMDNSPAVGLLEPGDVVTHIDGEEVKFWTDFRNTISGSPDKTLHFTVLRDGQSKELDITPQAVIRRDSMDIMTKTVGQIGITPDLAPPVIGLTSLQLPAAKYGLKTFDEITAVNGNPIRSYVDLEIALRHNDSDRLVLTVLRSTKLDVHYGDVGLLEPIKIEIPLRIDSTSALGVASSNMYLSEIYKDSPAEKAGLEVGDHILEVDGKSVNVFRSFLDLLRRDWENPHVLKVQRGDDVFEKTIQLEKITVIGEFQEELPMIYDGFHDYQTPYIAPDKVSMSVGERLSHAAAVSVKATVQASTMLVVYVARMFQGRVSTKSLGGPIMIGHMASKAGENGLDAFMQMLAIISINLGILNLLPIPLFDGGKLVVLFVEAVKRGPLSMRTRQIIAYVGFVMVILILMLAFKNDIERMWNLFFS